MFDQILQAVKEHLGNNPEIAAAIPPGQEEAVHTEIANHISNTVSNPSPVSSGLGGILSSLESKIAAGGPVASAIEGGLVSSLASKFGLPPSITGAIAGALPGILQKYAQKTISVPGS